MPGPDLEIRWGVGGGGVSKTFFGWSKNKVGGTRAPLAPPLDLLLSYGNFLCEPRPELLGFYTCQLFLRYKREIFILGVLDF